MVQNVRVSRIAILLPSVQVEWTGHLESFHLMMPTVALWNKVAVDLIIGPWTIDVNGQPLSFRALTCIDPVTYDKSTTDCTYNDAFVLATQYSTIAPGVHSVHSRCLKVTAIESITFLELETMGQTSKLI